MTIQAKLGSMVAYQGDVKFEHAGSGGIGRMLKKAVTGEGTQLMKMTGTGEVFLADPAQDIHLIYLENDSITVNGPNLLAFDAGIDWDIERVQGASSMMGGGLFNMSLQGTGWVAILSDGPPVLLNVARAPTFADAQAAITWSAGRHDRHQDRRQPQEPDRPRLGRVDPDGVLRPGLGARAALRGPGPRRHQPQAAAAAGSADCSTSSRGPSYTCTRSSASGSSVTTSHAGQYQRASSTPPHASCR